MSSTEASGLPRPRDPAAASRDLQYLRDLLARTERRVDPHSFHFIHWGAIVLVWYPLSNVFALDGNWAAMIGLGIGALLLGSVLSGLGEWRLARRGGPAQDTVLSRQISKAVWGCLAPAILLSAAGPPLGLVPGPYIPLVWGLAYAAMAYMVGVVYRAEYLWAGAAIFVGCLLALRFPDYNGMILGPFMGLGLLVPGWMGKRRERRLLARDAVADAD